jgi:hypothetical protein
MAGTAVSQAAGVPSNLQSHNRPAGDVTGTSPKNLRHARASRFDSHSGMNLYPLNLVLAVAIASATLFFGYLPARRLTAHFFTRWTLRFGGLWLAVAALTPPEILHYSVLLALICFIAWWRLHGGHGLGGKFWLCLAAGFGLSLAPVLILAVTPMAWPDQSLGRQVLVLISLYVGGAVPGLAFILFLFTRREATEARVPTFGLARLLVWLTLIKLALFVFIKPQWNLMDHGPGHGLYHAPDVLVEFQPTFLFFVLVITCLVSPSLALQAQKKIRSPTPSASGPWLLGLAGLAFGGECLAHWFGL